MFKGLTVLRNSFLWMSQNRSLRRWMESSSTAHALTSRFIAGLSLEDGISLAKTLGDQGIQTALDHLGENVGTVQEAKAAGAAALGALSSLAQLSIGGTVAIKLTQLGLDLSMEEGIANLEPLVMLAKQAGTRVEVDMESSAYTDRTLRIVEAMHLKHGSIRAVIQAYLYRSEADVHRLNQLGIPIRLCKGAYNESAVLAMAEKSEVDKAFLRLMRVLLEDGKFPAIATHDPAILQQATAFAKEIDLSPSEFEFEMLYGVRRDLQQQIRQQGFNLRLYVPYGEAWYPYFMRRLAERPANVWFLARNLLRS